MSVRVAKLTLRCAASVAVLLVLPACSVSYSLQAVGGQMQLVTGRQSVAELLQGDKLKPALRSRLELSQEVLDFAHTQMRLPDNDSYRAFMDTERPYVVWNVFAAPALSLQPRSWCFPVAGCVAYRGYFAEDNARRFAAGLADRGEDVFVGGVRAYSTLGRFRDPLLNTMLPLSDADFAALIFHELAHQLLYVKNDSAFNEAFASAVEQEGLRRWADASERTLPDRSGYESRTAEVRELLRNVRAELKRLYASELNEAEKLLRKQEVLDQVQETYSELEVRWRSGVPAGEKIRRPYAGLIRAGLNNASLAAVATYDNYVPAFQRLLVAACDYDLECFYAAARSMARMPKADRKRRLAEILADALRMDAIKNPAGPTGPTGS